jgi:hypothetical protein
MPSDFQAGIPNMAASAATYAGGVPGGLTTGIGLAAAFGYAPRILDPFTQAIHAGKTASAMRGGFMASGAGAAAGIGAAAVTLGGYYAAGAAADYLAFDPFKTGAQMRGQTLGAIHSFMPQAPMSSMASTAAMMENIQRQSGGMYGIGDLSNLMGMGVSGGDIRTMDMNSFQSDFKTLISKTKEVAQALSSSLTEAYGAMKEIKSLGVSDVAGTAYGMRGLGVAAGISPAEMMGIARGGSMLAKQSGISRDIGVSGAMSSAATFGYIGQRKLLGEDFGLEDLGTFQNAGYRFFGSMQGQKVLAAMMNQRGEIDESIAQQIAQGTISKSEINRLSNITLNKRQDLFGAHSSELVATYLSQYGPQGIVNPLSTMTQGMANPLSARQGLTGLNQEQMHELSLLNSSSASLKQQIANAAVEGFAQGTQKLGLQDQLTLAVSKMTAPVREKFQQMGASVAQSIAESIEDVTKDFVTRPTTVTADYSGVRAMRSALSTGNFSRASNIESMLSGGGGLGMRQYQLGPRSGGFLQRNLPRALSAEAYGEEIDLLPTTLGIHGLDSYQSTGDLLEGAALGVGLGGRLAGASYRNAGMLANATLGRAGRYLTGLGAEAAAEGGLAGVGLAAGSVRMAGGALRLASLGARVLGPVGAALAVKDSWELGAKAGHYINALTGMESFADADYTKRGQMMRMAQEAGLADPNEVMRMSDAVHASSGGKDLIEIAGTAQVRYVENPSYDPNYIPPVDATTGYVTHENPVINDPMRMYFKRDASRTLANINKFDTNKTISALTQATDGAFVSQLRGIAGDQTKSTTQKEQELRGLMLQRGADLQRQGKGTSASDLINSNKGAIFALMKEGGHYDETNETYVQQVSSKLDEARNGNRLQNVAADFMSGQMNTYQGLVAEVLTEGKYGIGNKDAFAQEVNRRFTERFTGAEAVQAQNALAIFKDAQPILIGAGLEPLQKAAHEINLAYRNQYRKEGGEVKEFMSMAAGSAGMTGVVSEASKSLFAALGNDNVGPVQRTQAMTEFYEKMIDSKATAEQLGAFTSRMGMSRTELGIDIAAAGAGYTRMLGLEEQFFGKGRKGKGKQWAEAFLGTSLSGVGLEDWVSGKSKTATADARQRIEKGIIDMMVTTSGGALSPDQIRTAESNVQKVLDHMKGGGTGDVKELAKLFQAPSGNATPPPNAAQQAKLMADFNTTIDSVTKKMQKLADVIPAGS